MKYTAEQKIQINKLNLNYLKMGPKPKIKMTIKDGFYIYESKINK